MKPVIWGAHLSKQASFVDVVGKVLDYGITAVQLFPHSPYSYFVEKGFDTRNAITFGLRCKERGIVSIFHSSFFINLASPKNTIWGVSKKSLADDLRLANRCDVPYVVTHVGSHTKDYTFEQGVYRVVSALDSIAESSRTGSVKLLLECHAGGGTSMCGNLDIIHRIISLTKETSKPCLGVCCDLAHMYGYGYNLCDPKVVEQLLAHPIWPLVKVVHFNTPDASVILGSHQDRHRCNFSSGAIPESVMESLFEIFSDKILILERPQEGTGKQVSEEDLSSLTSDIATMKLWEEKRGAVQ